MTEYATRWCHGTARAGVGVLAAGSALIAVGGYLTYPELRRRALRRGTETVSPRLAFHPESLSK